MPRGQSSSSHLQLTRLFVPEEIASSPAPLPPPPTKLPKLSNSITRSGRCIRSLHTRPLILHSSPHLSFITFPSLMGWAAFGRLGRLSTLALACPLTASPPCLLFTLRLLRSSIHLDHRSRLSPRDPFAGSFKLRRLPLGCRSFVPLVSLELHSTSDSHRCNSSVCVSLRCVSDLIPSGYEPH